MPHAGVVAGLFARTACQQRHGNQGEQYHEDSRRSLLFGRLNSRRALRASSRAASVLGCPGVCPRTGPTDHWALLQSPAPTFQAVPSITVIRSIATETYDKRGYSRGIPRRAVRGSPDLLSQSQHYCDTITTLSVRG